MAPLLSAMRSVARRFRTMLDADGVSLTQANGACAGQMVAHMHFHLIPRYNDHPLCWTPNRYENAEAMHAMAERLRVQP